MLVTNHHASGWLGQAIFTALIDNGWKFGSINRLKRLLVDYIKKQTSVTSPPVTTVPLGLMIIQTPRVNAALEKRYPTLNHDPPYHDRLTYAQPVLSTYNILCHVVGKDLDPMTICLEVLLDFQRMESSKTL